MFGPPPPPSLSSAEEGSVQFPSLAKEGVRGWLALINQGATMLKHKLLFSMLLLSVLVTSVQQAGYSRTARKGTLLYMTLTKGFHHESVELSKQVVKEMGEKSGAFDTAITERHPLGHETNQLRAENRKSKFVPSESGAP
jgi:hypothetical protein